MHLLMNHSLSGVNAGYITRAKLISGHLQATQEKLTKTIFGGAKLDAARWPNLPSRMIGDRRRDPPQPDPRSNKAREDRFWAVEAPRLLKAAMRRSELPPTDQPPEPPRAVSNLESPTQRQTRPQPDPVRSLLTM